MPKPNWNLRKERYGPTGAKNPEEYRKHCSESQKGHAQYYDFTNHNYGDVCKECGQNHGPIEPHIKALMEWKKTHPNPFEGHEWGQCHCGEIHGLPPMLGKHHSEASKEKSSESNKLAHNTPEMLAKKSADAKRQWSDPDRLRRRAESFEEHETLIQFYAADYQRQGFQILTMDRHIRPDILLRKDGKVYAVEIDIDKNTRRHKYDGVTFFDDVFWIRRVRQGAWMEYCENCGEPFTYDIPAADQHFCCHPCYAAKMEGKPIPWQEKMLAERGLKPIA